MAKYVVKKALNNNVVIVSKGNEELILVGKGIGFQVSKGTSVDEDTVESIFVKEADKVSNHYDKVLSTIDNSIVGLSEEIISLAERTLKVKLNKPIHVSLPDHINFAIRRNNENIRIENPFINEIKTIYPEEFGIALKGLNMLNERLQLDLPEDEVGYICLHIKAAMSSNKISNHLDYTRKIGEIMNLISSLLERKLNRDSLEYARTLTHINFMIERVLKNKTIENYFIDTIKKEMYYEFTIAIKVALKIEGLFSVDVPENEIGYLALHLRRLSEI